MKTEERVNSNVEVHEEEELNDVNDVLQAVMPYWRAIAGVLVLGLGALVLFNVLSSGREAALESSWSNYLAATANRDPQQLQTLADSSSGDVAGWAQHSAAQAKLIEACNLVHSDRAEAKKSFEEAVAGFTKAVALANGQTLIQKQSMWGLGQAHEGLSEINKAKEQYQQIVDKWPESSVAEQAKKQITRLNDPATKEFYDWFYAQTPPAQQLPSTGEIPNLPFEVPDDSDISMPEPDDLTAPSEGDAAAEDSVLEAEKTEDASTEETATETVPTEDVNSEDVDSESSSSAEPDSE